MNIKQAATIAPAIAAVAPPALIIGGIALLIWYLSKDDKNKSENPPEKDVPQSSPLSKHLNNDDISRQNPLIPANSGGNYIVPPPFHSFPTNIPAEPELPAPLPSVIPALSSGQEFPVSKKTITREKLAEIFKHGGRELDRKTAVAALKALGFGKSAAYEVLSPDGRFAPWLQFAPDGIISWKI